MLSEEAKAQRNAYLKTYMREWRKRNPGKSAAAQARYWERKAEKLRKAEHSKGSDAGWLANSKQ